MHGSVAGATVHSCRWDKGHFRGKSQSSKYQRLSKDKS